MPPGNTPVFGIAGGIVRELVYFGIVVGSRLPPGTGSAQVMGTLENASAEKTAAVASREARIFSMVSSFQKEKLWGVSNVPLARPGVLR
jgi:hypothetical protein